MNVLSLFDLEWNVGPEHILLLVITTFAELFLLLEVLPVDIPISAEVRVGSPEGGEQVPVKASVLEHFSAWLDDFVIVEEQKIWESWIISELSIKITRDIRYLGFKTCQ